MSVDLICNSADAYKLLCQLIALPQFAPRVAEAICQEMAKRLPYCLDECDDGDALNKLAEVLCKPLHCKCLASGPQAGQDAVETRMGIPLLIDVLANDIQSSLYCPINKDSLQIIHGPHNGVAIVQDNKVLYTPSPSFVGVDTFDYQFFDDCCKCGTGHVEISVSDTPIPPTCSNGTATTERNYQVSIPLSDFVVEGTCNIPANGYTVANPRNGIVSVVNGVATFTPDINFIGVAWFEYTVLDSCGESCTAEILVSVTPNVVTAPVCSPDVFVNLLWGTSHVLDVLANDSADIDCGLVASSVCIVNSPDHGDAVVNINGTITYTPDANWCGNDQFVYKVMDGCGQWCSTTVNITVVPPGVLVQSCNIINSPGCDFLVLNLTAPLVCPSGNVIVYFCNGTNLSLNGIVNGTSVMFAHTPGFQFSCADNPRSVACL